MTAGPYAGPSIDSAPSRRLIDALRAWLAALAAALRSAIGAAQRRYRSARRPLALTSGPRLVTSAPIAPRLEPGRSPPAADASPDARDESLAVSAALQFSAWASSAGVLGERDAPFLPVPVRPWFSPKLHPEVLSQLQAPSMPKLLDLTHAQTVDAELFANLAASWIAPATATPRLGVLVSFERWVTLRDTALAALQPLANRGIRLQMFYEQQAWGGQLDAWFRHGAIVHNLRVLAARVRELTIPAG